MQFCSFAIVQCKCSTKKRCQCLFAARFQFPRHFTIPRLSTSFNSDKTTSTMGIGKSARENKTQYCTHQIHEKNIIVIIQNLFDGIGGLEKLNCHIR